MHLNLANLSWLCIGSACAYASTLVIYLSSWCKKWVHAAIPCPPTIILTSVYLDKHTEHYPYIEYLSDKCNSCFRFPLRQKSDWNSIRWLSNSPIYLWGGRGDVPVINKNNRKTNIFVCALAVYCVGQPAGITWDPAQMNLRQWKARNSSSAEAVGLAERTLCQQRRKRHRHSVCNVLSCVFYYFKCAWSEIWMTVCQS